MALTFSLAAANLTNSSAKIHREDATAILLFAANV
jgi:hypothetical protein